MSPFSGGVNDHIEPAPCVCVCVFVSICVKRSVIA